MADPSDRLDSWKEIAAHLKRSVRTVTRWEQDEGLPVHRHLHSKSGTVYAFKAELDAWWTQRGAQLGRQAPATESSTRVARPWIAASAIAGILAMSALVWLMAT